MAKRIIWKIEKRKLADLKPHPKNPRQFTEKGMKDLENSINSIGFMQPININQDGTILSGHARALKLKEMGETEVDVYVPDRLLTPKQEEEVLVRANANTAGQWDFEILANEFDIDEINEWGLEVPDMEVETEELEAKEDDFDAEPPVNPKTVLGDLYQIGEHRLLCGDSTNVDNVLKLIDKNKKFSIYTDPPYGINEKGDRSNRGGACQGNNLKNFKDDTIQYAIDAYNITREFNPIKEVWWGANYYCHHLPQTNNWLVWDKRVQENQRDTQSDCELAFVNDGHSSIRIFRHLWKGMIKASECGQKRVHPTQKPIELASYCFNSYEMGNIILDLFGGSGATMVASHQTKRKCLMMEFEPHYCDVIVKRMIKLDPSLRITRNGEDCKNEFIENND